MDALQSALLLRRAKSIQPELLKGDPDKPMEGAQAYEGQESPKEELAEALQGPGEEAQAEELSAELDPSEVQNSEGKEDEKEIAQGGSPEEDLELLKAIAGNGDQKEMTMLQGMKPRSLGERAKMDALKKLHGKDAK